MSSNYLKFVSLLLLAVVIAACTKPDAQLIGRWGSDKTGTVMEFRENGSGVINLKHGGGVPSIVPFNWNMDKEGRFTVQMKAPGDTAVRAGRGFLQQDGKTLTLEDDPFRKLD